MLDQASADDGHIRLVCLQGLYGLTHREAYMDEIGISAFKIGTDRGNYEGAERVPETIRRTVPSFIASFTAGFPAAF